MTWCDLFVFSVPPLVFLSVGFMLWVRSIF